MAVQDQGFSGIIPEVETTTRAKRVTIRPIDFGALGSYRVSQQSGLTTALAAGAPVFAFRWGDSSRLALVRYIRVRAQVITGFTTAQEIAADVTIARSWTVSDSAGTALTISGNNGKKRASMGSTLLTDARISAAAALTAGTRTLDANPLIVGSTQEMAAAATVQRAKLDLVWDATNTADYPLVLSTNEGFVVRNLVLLGAAGTVRWSFEVAWDEVTAY